MSSPPENANPNPGSHPLYHRQLTFDETRNRRRAQRSLNQQTQSVNQKPDSVTKAQKAQSPTHSKPSQSRRTHDFVIPFPIANSPIHQPAKSSDSNLDVPQPLTDVPISREGSSGVPLPSPGRSVSSFGSNLEDDGDLLKHADVPFGALPGPKNTHSTNRQIPNTTSHKPQPADSQWEESSKTHPLSTARGLATFTLNSALGHGSRSAAFEGGMSDDGLSMLAAAGAKSGLGNDSRGNSTEDVNDNITFRSTRPEIEGTRSQAGLGTNNTAKSQRLSPLHTDGASLVGARGSRVTTEAYEPSSSSPFPDSPTYPIQSDIISDVYQTRPEIESIPAFSSGNIGGIAPNNWLPSRLDDQGRPLSGVAVKSPLQRLERSLTDGGQIVDVKKRGYRRYPSGKHDEKSVITNSPNGRERLNKRDPREEGVGLAQEVAPTVTSDGKAAWGDLRRRVVSARVAKRGEEGGTGADSFHQDGNATLNDQNAHNRHHPNHSQISSARHLQNRDLQKSTPGSVTNRNILPTPSQHTRIMSHPPLTATVAPFASHLHEHPMSHTDLSHLSSVRYNNYQLAPLPNLSFLANPAIQSLSDSTSTVNIHGLPQSHPKRLPLELLSDGMETMPGSEVGAPSWVGKQGMGYWAHEIVPDVRVSGTYSRFGSTRQAHQNVDTSSQLPIPSFDDNHKGIPNSLMEGTTRPTAPGNEQPGLFNPPLYLKCGPLLRFCGIHSTTQEKEIWRGSILIVTLDGRSVYQPGPTVRIFFPNYDGHHLKHDQDPISGTIKPSRIGKTLFVRSARDLIPGANLSAVENDGGLFQETPLEDLGGNDGSAWKSAYAADGSGTYSDTHGIRLFSDKHTTFWRFDLSIPLRDVPQKVGYRVNVGPPLFFSVPAKGRGMRIVVHSRNGVAETEKDRLGNGKGVDVDSGGLYFLGGPDPMWRDILNAHAEDPYHAMIGAGGQVVLDSAIKETIWFGDWWRRKLASAYGPQADVNLDEVSLGLSGELRRPGSGASRSISKPIPPLIANSHMSKGPPAPPSSPDTGAGIYLGNDSSHNVKSQLHGVAASMAPRPHAAMSADMRAELELFFTLKYSAAFSHGLMSLAGSMIPSVNVWSEEGEGFRAFDSLDRESAELRSDPIVVEAWKIALKYYLLFQHHTLLGDGSGPGQDSAFNQSWISSPYTSSLTGLPSKSFFLSMGSSMAFLALDTCSDRDSNHIIRRETYEAISIKLNSEIVRGRTRHLVVCVGGPMVFPRKKVYLGGRNGISNKKHSVTKTIAGLFSDKDKQREDDRHLGSDGDHSFFPATWTDSAFTSERRGLIHMLQQVAREKNVRVTLLSCSASAGVAAVGQFLSRDATNYTNTGIKTLPKHYDFRYMPSIVAPSTSALPVGPSVISELQTSTQDLYYQSSPQAKVYSGSKPFPTRRFSQSEKQNPRMLQFLQSAVYPLDGATDESMIPLFGDSLGLYEELQYARPAESESQTVPYFMHRRGWCSISEFAPGRSPASSVHNDGDGRYDDEASSDATAAELASENRSMSAKPNRLSRLFSLRRKSVGERKEGHIPLPFNSTESWKPHENRSSVDEPEGRRSFSQRLSLRLSTSRPPTSRGGPSGAPPRSFFNQISCMGARDGHSPSITDFNYPDFEGGGRPYSGMGSNRGMGGAMSPDMGRDSTDCGPCRNSFGSRRDAGILGSPQVSNLPSAIAGRRGYNSARNSMDTPRMSTDTGPSAFKRRATIIAFPDLSPEQDIAQAGRRNSIDQQAFDQLDRENVGKPQRRSTISRLWRRNTTGAPHNATTSRNLALQSPTSAGFSVDELAHHVEERVRLDLENGYGQRAGVADGDEGMVDLRDGLDIRFCIEKHAGSPEGQTQVFRMLVPALWESDDQMGGRYRPGTAMRGSLDVSRSENQYPRPVNQTPQYTTYPTPLQRNIGPAKTMAERPRPNLAAPPRAFFNQLKQDSPQKGVSIPYGVENDDDGDENEAWRSRSESYHLRRYPSYPKF